MSSAGRAFTVYLCNISTAVCVGLCSDDGTFTEVDDIPLKSPTTRSLTAWDIVSKSSPADSGSTATSN